MKILLTAALVALTVGPAVADYDENDKTEYFIRNMYTVSLSGGPGYVCERTVGAGGKMAIAQYYGQRLITRGELQIPNPKSEFYIRCQLTDTQVYMTVSDELTYGDTPRVFTLTIDR
jgi:hypothetical protein